MNKFLVFHGRVHHGRKLMPIIMQLRSMGHECTFVTVNNAINIDPHTEPIIEMGESFIFATDYIESADVEVIDLMVAETLTHIFSRRREFTSIEYFSPFWIEYSVREACENIVAWKKLLALEKPSGVLILHENNFFTKSLSYIAHSMNVPCFAFQEGLLRKQDQETMHKQSTAADYSDRLFCWSQSAFDEYIEAGIERQKLFISGMVHLDGPIQLRNDATRMAEKRNLFGLPPDGRVAVFAYPQLSQYAGDVVADTVAVSKWCLSNKIAFIAKLHPLDSVGNEHRIKDAVGEGGKTLRTGESSELFSVSDIVFLQHSTVGLEALAFGLLLVEIVEPGATILQSWQEEGIAIGCNRNDFSALDEILSGRTSLDPDRIGRFCKNNLGPLDGFSAKRVADEIVSVVYGR